MKNALTLLFILVISAAQAQEWTFTEAHDQYLELVQDNEFNGRNLRILQFLKSENRLKGLSDNDYLHLLKVVQSDVVDQRPNDVELYYFLGKEFDRLQRYTLAFPLYYKISKEIENGGRPLSFNCDFYKTFGALYFELGRLDEAEVFLEKSSGCASEKDLLRIEIDFHLGLLSRERGNTPLALKLLSSSLELAQELRNKSWIGKCSGEIGKLYIQEEKAEEAKKWIDKALVLAYETKNNAAILRANLDRLQLALITKDWTEANARMRYLDEALLNRHSIKIRAEYYSLRSKWNEELGNYQKALVDYRSFRSLNDSLLKQQDLVAITNAEFQYEYEKKQVDYLLLEEKKRSETFLKWFLFLLLVILAFGVGIIFRQIQTKRKQEMEIFELKNQQMQETLNKTENELKNVVRNLIDKNKVLNELTAEIENLHKQQEDGKDTSKNEELWDQLQSFTLLTEEDWVEFKRLFEKRFSGFFDYFQSKFPDITNAEMRMAALLRLNLENIEMAKALGISPDSVRKTNLRLRKRLNIEDQRELLELIHSIG